MSQQSNQVKLARLALPAAIILMIAAGCAPASAPAATTEPPVATAAPTATKRAASRSQTEEAFAAQTQQAAPQGGSTPAQVNLAKPYDENAYPKADIDAALTAAKADSKYVLLDFGANWCPDCLVLAKLFEDPTVKPFLNANYHVVRIDVGYWDKNLDIANKYGNPIQVGIPAVVVLTPNGDIVATTKAGELANASSFHAPDVLAYLQKWAPKK